MSKTCRRHERYRILLLTAGTGDWVGDDLIFYSFEEALRCARNYTTKLLGFDALKIEINFGWGWADEVRNEETKTRKEVSEA